MVWLLGLLAVYLLILLAVAWFSTHPFRLPFYISPGALQAPQEEVRVPSGGLELRGWWMERPGSDRVVVLCHGYMMNRCEMTPEAFFFWQQGMSCLMLDFRAHGRSGGRLCTLGELERSDVVAAVEYARSRVPGARVALMGSSMGSAAAALAVAERPGLVDLLILDSCYSRLSSAISGWWRFIGNDLLAWFLAPVALVAVPLVRLNPFRVDVAKALAKIEGTPVLFLHGDCDRLASPEEARRNYEAANEPKRIVWWPGCNHSEGRWTHAPAYREELLNFLDEHGFLPSLVSGER
jgi:uncharacterized protein